MLNHDNMTVEEVTGQRKSEIEMFSEIANNGEFIYEVNNSIAMFKYNEKYYRLNFDDQTVELFEDELEKISSLDINEFKIQDGTLIAVEAIINELQSEIHLYEGYTIVSNDENIVEVREDGRIGAKNIGTTTILLTGKNSGETKTITVHVIPSVEDEDEG